MKLKLFRNLSLLPPKKNNRTHSPKIPNYTSKNPERVNCSVTIDGITGVHERSNFIKENANQSVSKDCIKV